MKDRITNYMWDDIKKKVQQIDISDEKIKSSNIVLFGRGRVGRYAYKRIKEEFFIIAFSDNNYGGVEEDLPVIEPDKLKEIDNIFVIITVNGQYYLPIKRQLEEMNIPYITYMEYILRRNFDKFDIVYHELLEDEFSKRTYIELLLSYLQFDLTYLKKIFVRNQYFEIPEFNFYSSKEVFVDCGAYVGDTLETFICERGGIFRQIYLFEPTERMNQALFARTQRLLKEWAIDKEKIIIEKKAVGQKNGIIKFSNEESVNRVIDNKKQGDFVEMVSLDEYFINRQNQPTFIKADIEGFEMALIEGAKNIISNQKPLIGISIYHNAEDLYEIPIKLKQLNPRYRMAIRQHMPLYYETVLYCYSE